VPFTDEYFSRLTATEITEAHAKAMVRDFPTLFYDAEKMWVKYRVAVQKGLLPAPIRREFGQWFLDIIKVWEGIYPNWTVDLQPPESVSAYNERIKFAHRVDAWAANVRGYRSTMGLSRLGALPVVMLGILVATSAIFLSVFGLFMYLWQGRKNQSDRFNAYVEGKITAEEYQAGEKAYQAETGISIGSMLGLGDLGSLAKYALIGAGVYLTWPFLSPLLRKLAGKLGGGRG